LWVTHVSGTSDLSSSINEMTVNLGKSEKDLMSLTFRRQGHLG